MKTIKKSRKTRIKQNKRYKKEIRVCLIIICIALFSIIFSNFFDIFLKLYPNTRTMEYRDSFQIHFVDVGQGLAVLVRMPNGDNIMLDTGSRSYEKSLISYIDNVFFKDWTNKSLDYLILSHTDEDHSGNMKKVLEKYKPKTVYIPNITDSINESIYLSSCDEYKQFYIALKKAESKGETSVKFNMQGEEIGGYAKWLAPNRSTFNTSNEFSPIIIISANEKKFMFTGDSGHNIGVSGKLNIENASLLFAENNNIDIDIDLLCLGHHGSKYSTSSNFLESIMPEQVVISAGDNVYGHPAIEVLTRLSEYDSMYNKDTLENLRTTKKKGNIIAFVNKLSPDLSFVEIKNINEYIFIHWWVLMLLLVIINIAYILLLFFRINENRQYILEKKSLLSTNKIN